MTFSLSLKRFQGYLGTTGIAALCLLAAAAAFSSFVLGPLQARGTLMQEKLSKKTTTQPGSDKVAAVYEYLKKDEDTTDWLAKLHGIGAATGVQLRSASYRTQQTEGRIERYEIVLPASGSYAQIRDFLKRALAEVPVLSLDQLTLRRENGGSEKNSGAIQAEMRLTLHMVKS
jgi:Tfp pilus assembly protein PilO